MCLIVIAYQVHAEFPLVVAANRDEFYARPAQQAAFWRDRPSILAGRDLEGQGTWLGITRAGWFAAVTNYRDPADDRASAKSRGMLVSGFLEGSTPPTEFLAEVQSGADAYRGFNLLASDGNALYYYSNRAGAPQRLDPGIYGLSNHLLDTPWPKVETARARLRGALAPRPAAESLFAMMADTETAPDAALPQTGLAQERERMLSAARIVSTSYGTRCSTVLLLSREGGVRFSERTYGPEGVELDTVNYEFSRAA